MKIKTFLLLLILLVSVAFAPAQQLLHWGIKFGLDVPANKNDFSPKFTYDKTLNYNLGFQLRIGERWFGQVGIDYHINKCSLMWKDTITSNQNLELGYLTVPLQAGFHIVQNDNVSFRIMLGFQYKVLVYLSKNDIGIDRNYFQVHNMDLMGGLGLDFYSFTFDIGYRKSLFPIVADSKHYRDMLSLSLGLNF